ncbi:MAG: 30S ribosomal protein S8 [bacterium]
MSITDPIADMLTRIRNARLVQKNNVIIPASKIKVEILKVLKKEGYIGDFVLENSGATILANLENTEMQKAIRVSKPGRRVYAGKEEIPSILQGQGLVIISTSKGVMSGKEAKKLGLGGELICKVW